MKILKTANYLNKESQFRDFNLPPGVTDRMIEEQFGGEEETESFPKQSGEYEAQINWEKETNDLINVGYDVQGLPQTGYGTIKVYYTYDAEVYNGEATISNLNLSDMMTFEGQKYMPLIVPDPTTKQGVFEGLQDEIVKQEKIIIQEQSQSSF